jgi:hypothetical protein
MLIEPGWPPIPSLNRKGAGPGEDQISIVQEVPGRNMPFGEVNLSTRIDELTYSYDRSTSGSEVFRLESESILVTGQHP